MYAALLFLPSNFEAHANSPMKKIVGYYYPGQRVVFDCYVETEPEVTNEYDGITSKYVVFVATLPNVYH